jgi:hypothetical protein
MRRSIVCFVVAAIVSMGGWTSAQRPTAERILLESTLWGPDYPALLPVLRALRDAGETKAYIFTDRVAGASAFPSEEAARSRAEKSRSLVAQPPALRPQFAQLQKQAPAGAPLRIETARLIDDDGQHVVANRPGARLLAAGLTIQAVRGRLGEAERVIEQTIQNRGERRPVILKLHVYAAGAIAFAESNMAEPGVVERVVVDLARVVPLVTTR